MIGLAACALAGAAPAAASAATYCVHQPADPCAPGATDEGADLQAALDLAEANSNADTIQIGPGTFAPTTNQGFTYLSSNPVDIVGAGRGQTTITDRGHATQTLTLGNNTTGPRTITLSHLSVAPAGLTSFVVVLSGGTLTDVDVSGNLAAVGLHNADYEGGVVTDSGGSGIVTFDAVSPLADKIEDVRIDGSGAPNGIEADANTEVHRVRITSQQPVLAQSAPVYIDDSLLLATFSDGLRAFDNSAEGSINALNVTVVSLGGTGKGALAEDTSMGTNSSEIDLTNSIIRGFGTSLEADGSGTHGVITQAYVNLDGATAGTGTVFPDGNPVAGDPTFVNAAGGDYHLRFDSPLIDRSPMTDLGSASSTTDRDGNPRVVNAHGGSTPVDIGAFEYQHRPPVAVAAATPGHAGIGRPFTFDGTGSSDPDPGDGISYAWSFDDGSHAAGQSGQHAFATSGQHTGTLTVTDSSGLTASKAVAVTVDPPPASTSPIVQLDPRLTVGATKLKGTEVDITLTCLVATCNGKATETTIEHLGSQGKIAGLTAAAKKTRKRKVTVGSRSFSIPAGKSVTVKVPLGAAGRKLLPKFGKLPVALVVQLTGRNGRPTTVKSTKLTIRPAKKHKRG